MRRITTPCARSRQQGAYLVEMALTLALLGLLVLAAAGTLLSSRKLAEDSELDRLAREAAHNELERLRSLPFPDVATSAQGRAFVVDALPPRVGGDPNHCRVTVHLDEDDANNPALQVGAGGVDLDGNGSASDSLAVTSRYRVIPVTIDVTWDSPSGQQHNFELNAVVTSNSDFLRLKG